MLYLYGKKDQIVPPEPTKAVISRLKAPRRVAIYNEGWHMLLRDKQREVVSRRFGLRGYGSSTLEEVGREIGLTRERVRQIQVEALKRLRSIMETQGLSGESLFS